MSHSKIAVLTIMYEHGDERCSAYIDEIKCFQLGDDLNDRVKDFLLNYVKVKTLSHKPGSCFSDEIDYWLLEEDDLLFIDGFLQAQIDIVDIL